MADDGGFKLPCKDAIWETPKWQKGQATWTAGHPLDGYLRESFWENRSASRACCLSAAWVRPGSGWGALSTEQWAIDQDSWSPGLGFHLSYATRPLCDLGEVPYPCKPQVRFTHTPAVCGQSEPHPTGLSWRVRGANGPQGIPTGTNPTRCSTNRGRGNYINRSYCHFL